MIISFRCKQIVAVWLHGGLVAEQRLCKVQAADMMSTLSPEQLQSYSAMANSAGAAAAGPASMPDAAQAAAAAKMMEGMSTEDLQGMMSAAQSSGMMPAGMNMSPEALKVRGLPRWLCILTLICTAYNLHCLHWPLC